MQNFLLTADLSSFDIDFNKLNEFNIREAYEVFLTNAENEFKNVLQLKSPSFRDLFVQNDFEKLMNLHRLISSLNCLLENEKYREIEEEYSEILSEKIDKWTLNKKMYKKIISFSNTSEYLTLNELRKKMIQESLKDLKNNGVNLSHGNKKKLITINKKIALLSQKFQNNITDANDSFNFLIKKEDLIGLSDRAINNIVGITKKMNIKNGKFYIDEISGSIDDIMKNSNSEKVRRKIYEKNKLLCLKGKYKNTKLIDEIYKLKQSSSNILNYKTFAHMALEENMASSPKEVLAFLDNLGNIALPYAKKEHEKIISVGKKILNREVNWWDIEYINEHILKEDFYIDSEEVRMYFKVENVITKLFELCKEMFDLNFIENKEKITWNKDVKFFDVYENEQHIGGMFIDIYKRPGKSPGAWLEPLSTYENNDIAKIKPTCLLVCNVTKDFNQESTFEVEDVVTLFHEMGHALHHLLSKVEEEFFSGFNNVEHDAVEIPSQLMENFVYNKDVLKKITSHILTGESIPDEIIEKIQKSKKYLGAKIILNMVRFSEMDINLYLQNELHPYEIENISMEKWKITDNYDKTNLRMPMFSHIFGGGYESGYYSYQWAEVFSIDGFNYLTTGTKEEIKEKLTKYKKEILYTGGSRPMKESYKHFKPEEVDLNSLIDSYI